MLFAGTLLVFTDPLRLIFLLNLVFLGLFFRHSENLRLSVTTYILFRNSVKIFLYWFSAGYLSCRKVIKSIVDIIVIGGIKSTKIPIFTASMALSA